MRGYTMIGLLAPVAACLIGAFFACAQLDLIQRQREEIRALKAQVQHASAHPEWAVTIRGEKWTIRNVKFGQDAESPSGVRILLEAHPGK